MKVVSTVCSLLLVLMASACASKSGYRDQHGNALGATDYRYDSAPSVSATPISRPAPGMEWPRVFTDGSVTNTVYQTQADSWDGSALTGKNAVMIQSSAQPQPAYGVVTFRATTVVNKESGTVSLLNVQVQNADFPSLGDKAGSLLEPMRKEYPRQIQSLPVSTVEAALAANAEKLKAAGKPVDNTPPQIVFTSKPAVLVSIDGEPALRPVAGTDLQRVINTRYLLLKDPQGRFYLRLPQGYLSADKLEGPWHVASAPAGAAAAEKQTADSGQVEIEDATNDPASTQPATPPSVVVSTKPTELISFVGEPNYVPIPGTQLLYVTNTTANVFKLLSDQQTYVLLSGRWFRGPDYSGPWDYVSAQKLPADFGKIPDTSPKENVKASVPGTPQAREALIANSIPQTAAVPRTSQMPQPQIDGPPRLAPIAGTPLHYVENSGTPIINVDEKTWYACQSGIWYVATSVNGPWAVADSVPAVIYTIPPSSPMHYVTYVKVYDSNDSMVYQGYTPGYMGTVVDTDGVVVYGTGYYYRPWVGSVWYGPAATWGYGWSPFWSPWWGWSYGFGFGWWYSGYYPYSPYYGYHHYWACSPPSPGWGPYRTYTARAAGGRTPPERLPGTAANLYQRPTRGDLTRVGPSASSVDRAVPVYGRAYNSRTGTLVAGEQGQVQNVFSSTAGMSRFNRPSAQGPGDTIVTRDGRAYVRNPAGVAGPVDPSARNLQRSQPAVRVAPDSKGWSRGVPPPAASRSERSAPAPSGDGGGWDRGNPTAPPPSTSRGSGRRF